ncbi:NAD(P)-binding protein [Dendrothele bispora CBS 962.96]|uniref:NAD(P)-binding protein n=1 Tax=Dendrothele bispora (strain CBS 962.96) TaxID=1314807 RepID=A0A4V4HC32_DENBC|nr:NAD(P)-binding protein [Dendrothele bispora CBS 962.96]
MSDYKRVILVTGSNAGIGYSTVKLLASKGQTVYLSARNEAAGKEAQQKLKTENNLNVKFVQLDITDIKSVQAAKDVIEKAEGKLDVLVHNAGISYMDKDQNATTVDINTIRAAFEPNFYGVIQTTQVFLPLIRKGKEGYKNILLITTDMASNAFQAKPNSMLHVTAYNTSKAAANSYIIALAHELKPEGILVNCVTPGFTTTKLNGYHEGGKTTDQAAEFVAQWTLLGPGDKDKTCLFYNDAGEFPW